MTSGVRPAFERGVRLRTTDDGTAMLLVPEGAVKLNGSAAAALALVDGQRTVDEIVDAICARFDVADARARDDVTALFARLAQRRMLVLS
ncbi:MAG: pyrroloquinoline quinone biosynthesis peptide chaperone PqqD [Candidatus Velthaea sp.]|jgi:pyrroloquinoline quinone biosynthesis protein D